MTLELLKELNELKKRVKVLEDIEEIKKLHHDYIYLLNAREWEKIIDLFAEDATEDGFPRGEKRAGKEEIAKVYRAMDIGSRGTPLHTTIVAQPVISVKGDTAKGYWLWLGRINDSRPFVGGSGLEGDVLIQIKPLLGRYDMEYKRVDGEWKISKLKYILPWPKVKNIK